VFVRATQRGSVCVCVSERQRERESVCVSEREREKEPLTRDPVVVKTLRPDPNFKINYAPKYLKIDKRGNGRRLNVLMKLDL
jgi:hypothetical protein